jgi:hypothetical protein
LLPDAERRALESEFLNKGDTSKHNDDKPGKSKKGKKKTKKARKKTGERRRVKKTKKVRNHNDNPVVHKKRQGKKRPSPDTERKLPHAKRRRTDRREKQSVNTDMDE